MRRKRRCPLYPVWRPQNQNSAKVMPALLPNADMCSALTHVRFGPIADIPFSRCVWLPMFYRGSNAGVLRGICRR